MDESVKPESNNYNIRIVGCECVLDRLEGNTFYIKQIWYTPQEKEPPKDRPFIVKYILYDEPCYVVLQWFKRTFDGYGFWQLFADEKWEVNEIEKWTEIPL